MKTIRWWTKLVRAWMTRRRFSDTKDAQREALDVRLDAVRKFVDAHVPPEKVIGNGR